MHTKICVCNEIEVSKIDQRCTNVITYYHIDCSSGSISLTGEVRSNETILHCIFV